MDPLIFLLLNTLHFKIKSRIFQILRLSVDRSLKGCCLFYRTRLFLSKRSSFFSCFDLLLKVSSEVQTSRSLQPFLSSVARSFNRQHEQLTETHRAKGEQAEVEIVTHVRGGMGLFVGRRVLECTGVEERPVERVFVCSIPTF